MAQAVKEYDARLDSKKRITLRGAQTLFYRVRENNDGTIELSPRVLVHPDEISTKTLSTIDQSINNLKNNSVSTVVDMNELTNLLD
jgi:predicted amino acid racemase